MAYNSDSIVQTLSAAIAADPAVVGKIYNKQLREGARSVDDFSMFEGKEGSGKPFIVRDDLNRFAGDEVKFTVMSQPRGPGSRGEQELRGRESRVDFKTFSCVVDFWRDAVKYSAKQLQFMAAGGVKMATLKLMREKLGRKRMNDMKMALKLQASGNIIFPNGRKTLATLNGLDTLTPALITNAVPQWRRNGGKSINLGKNKHGSPVYRPMLYIPDAAVPSIKNSSSYEQAMTHAAGKGDENPLFTGRLTDWNGVGLFEHVSVDPENDQAADPLAPRAVLAVGFGVDSAQSACVIKGHASDTLTPYTAFLGGYEYEWWEGQKTNSAWTSFYSAITGATYYGWIINPDGSVGFVSWTGSGNDGNKITLTGILDPGTGTDQSTLGDDTLGNFVATGDSWGLQGDNSTYVSGPGGQGGSSNCSPDFTWTSEFDAGAYLIPCNANGVPDMCSLLLGAESAVRCYVGDDKLIGDKDDYNFVEGGGYQSIFGQAPCIRTDGKTAGYALIRHGGQHPGLDVPQLTA